MDIWVEPTDWDDKGKRPIIQLEVRATNYVGVAEVTGSQALAACKSDDVKCRNFPCAVILLMQTTNREPTLDGLQVVR